MSATMRCDRLRGTMCAMRPATDVANGVCHRPHREVVAEEGVGVHTPNRTFPIVTDHVWHLSAFLTVPVCPSHLPQMYQRARLLAQG